MHVVVAAAVAEEEAVVEVAAKATMIMKNHPGMCD